MIVRKVNGLEPVNGNVIVPMSAWDFVSSGEPADPVASPVYMNTSTKNVYVYNNELEEYELKATLSNGAKGDDGEKGETGDVVAWYNGVDIPNNDLGKDGDYYIRSTDGMVYKRIDGEYVDQGFTIKGVKGDDGEQGDSFTFEDFTPEQLEDLKGETGETGRDGDSFVIMRYFDSYSAIENFNYPEDMVGTWFVTVANVNDTDHNNLYTVQYNEVTEEYDIAYVKTLDDALAIKGERGERGEKGEKGDDGEISPEILGELPLLTEDQTIYGAINEVFLSGNNVKQNVIDALLQHDSELEIDVDSPWDDLVEDIEKLPVAKGTEERIVTVQENVKAGDLLALNIPTNVSLYGHSGNLPFSNAFSNTYESVDVAPYQDDKFLFVYPRGSDQKPGIALLRHNGNSVSVLANAELYNGANLGRCLNILKLNETTYVISYSPTTWATSCFVVTMNGDSITVGTPTSLESSGGTGYTANLCRINDTRFALICYQNNISLGVKSFNVNPSNRSVSAINVTTKLGADVALFADANHVFDTEKGGLSYGKYSESTANTNTTGIMYTRKNSAGTNVEATNKQLVKSSAGQTKAMIIQSKYDYKGDPNLVLFHVLYKKNTDSTNHETSYIRAVYNISTGQNELFKNLNIGLKSDTYWHPIGSYSFRKDTTSAVEVADGVIAVIFRSSSVYNIAFVDVTGDNPHIITEYPITTVSGNSITKIVECRNGRRAFLTGNILSGTTQMRWAVLDIPTTYRKAKLGDTIYGVAKHDALNGEDVLVIKPNYN